MCSCKPELPAKKRSIVQRILIAPVTFYRLYISPMTPPSCRYSPTCSAYMVEAIDLWGVYGVWLGVKRLARCHPFVPGGHDPVPRPPERG